MNRIAMGCALLCLSLAGCGSERGMNGGSPEREGRDFDAAEADGATEPSADADLGGTADAPIQVDLPALDVDGADDGGLVDDPAPSDSTRSDDAPVGICEHVDILFVIDNSGSMADQQRSLIRSFPGFIAGIQDRLRDALSVRIGVVASDDYPGRPGCGEIGHLITVTRGPESSRRDCGPFDTREPWLDLSERDLADKFACVAQVGTGGDDDERMMRAALNALNPANAATGACNEGFPRPDSFLIVVLISDEDDIPDECSPDNWPDECETNGSGGTPDEWVAELAGYRGGSTDDVVVLSLIGRAANNSCGAVVASKLLGFARRFGDNGLVGDVCAEDYDPFFLEALPVIQQACLKL